MGPDNDRKDNKAKPLILLITALVIGAGLLGWQLGKSDEKPDASSQQTNTPTQATPTNNASPLQSVKSLVSYTLPDGWKEASCPPAEAVYIVPAGAANADCSANPSTPVKISIDGGNNKDCNQLQNVQNVKKHICVSQFINGHKSLKATTEHLASSSYKRETTVNAYYIDTGKGVAKLEYIYSSDGEFQAAFDQLANSVNVKN